MDYQCIQASSSKSFSVPNFRGSLHIYIARQSDTLAKRSNYVLCGNMNMEVSPYILKLKLFFKNTCSAMTGGMHVSLLQSKIEMIYLLKKVILIIIYRNTTHLLGVSCCHKHQQQRYHNENTKICMFIHYMYVDILFPLTKTIPIMFERVTTHYETLETWIGHNKRVTIYFLSVQHGLELFRTDFHSLASKLHKKKTYINFKKNN